MCGAVAREQSGDGVGVAGSDAARLLSDVECVARAVRIKALCAEAR